MGKLQKIKAAQLKEDPKFYGDAEKVKGKVKPKAPIAEVKAKPLSRLDKIKAAQIKETPELYAPKQKVPDKDSEVDASLVGIGLASFEQLQAVMETDIARIKSVKKIPEKVALKEKLLSSYLPFVMDYTANEHDYPCSVAVQSMIWAFDVGNIELALNLGLYLEKTGNQQMPEKFKRDLITFVCDEVYEWAKTQLENKQSASPYLDEIIAYVDDNEQDLHPLVISKNLVMLAKHRDREENYVECVALCERAEQANPEGAGVKTLKNKALAKVEAAKAK